jgi:hypothetical protein
MFMLSGLCGSFAGGDTSCAIATDDKAQQATAPATIPTGNTTESTLLPQIIHIFTAVHIVKMRRAGTVCGRPGPRSSRFSRRRRPLHADRRRTSGGSAPRQRETAQDAVEWIVDVADLLPTQSNAIHESFRKGCAMADRNTEERLRRELDQILLRLERQERTTLSDARSEGARLVGDMFADAQVVAS